MPTPSTPAAERIAFLRREIARHDRLYYVEARPEIGDADYDRLYRELEQLEREHPELDSPDSPTRRVGGAPIKGFEPVRHDPPMMSLDKTHSHEDLAAFDTFLRRQIGREKPIYVVEPKIDGCAFSLRYEAGRLVRAATRGSGEVGDDVTQNVRTIRSVPLQIATVVPVVEVRGEVFMTKAGFLKLTHEQEDAGQTPFINPRNAAAGSLKLLDPRQVAKRPLDAVLYGVGALEGIAFATHAALLEQLKIWGFRVPDYRLCEGLASMLEAVAELEKRRHDFAFEMDGAVIKDDDRSHYDRLGSTAKSPRWARAFKYQPERGETVVEAITVQVGRTGVLTPVAELRPVFVGGTTISRATLHNADEVRRKDIRVGDHVWIVRAGDVIPAVEAVIGGKRSGAQQPFVMPEGCPACAGAVTRAADEAATRCANPACPAQVVGRLQHFAARGALDIAGIGSVLADRLVESGLVRHPLDLFSLTVDQLAVVSMRKSAKGEDVPFGAVSARKVMAAVEAARHLPLERWLYAIGIPRIGATVAEQAASCHDRLADLAGSPRLMEVVRLGERSAAPRKTAEKPVCPVKYEAAKALLAFFGSGAGQEYLRRLDRLGIHPASEAAPAPTAQGPLSGKTLVITGSLSRPRGEIAAMIKQAGGKLAEAVSKTTDYLVVGADPGGAKFNKARELGTRLATEQQLLELLNPTPHRRDADTPHQPELF